jgi:DNA excision repair protein ERCC-5
MLFYNIKPIFVFDGGVPQLKAKTLQKRRLIKERGRNTIAKTAEQLLQARMKLQAIQKSSQNKEDLESNWEFKNQNKRLRNDPFILPDFPDTRQHHQAQDPRLVSNIELQTFIQETITTDNLKMMNIDSPEFSALPLEIQYELANEMRYVSLTRV